MTPQVGNVARERNRLDPQAGRPQTSYKGTLCTGHDHIVIPPAEFTNKRHQKVVQRKINRTNLQNLHMTSDLRNSSVCAINPDIAKLVKSSSFRNHQIFWKITILQLKMHQNSKGTVISPVD